MRTCQIIDKPWKLTVLIVIEVVIFSIALWLSNRIAPGNEAVFNAITILCIFAVGITIILYGNVAKKRMYNTLGFALFLFAVFIVIDRYEGFAVKISAFAALLVAFAAFMSIEENRRLRDENRRLMVEERRRLALERIRFWAEDTLELLTRPIVSKNFDEFLKGMEQQIQPSLTRLIGISYDADILNRDLHEKVRDLTSSMTEFSWRLRSDEVIEKYKSDHKRVGLKRFANEGELTKLRREILLQLSTLIEFATGILVPKE